MKTLNAYGVCCDPEIINVYFKDLFHHIIIKIAETPQGWADGIDVTEHNSGTIFPCMLNGAKTRDEAIRRALGKIYNTRIIEENPKLKKMVDQYAAARIQLTLF